MFIHGDDDHDLGHTVAGWSGAGIAVLGFGLCGLAMVRASGLLALGGVAVLTTWMLHLAGWGKPSGPRPVAEWDWRVRDRTARGGHADCLGCRLAGRRASRRQTVDRPDGAVVAPVLSVDRG
ncbi:HGxxPAAW family protein [Streptomyces sp. NPDC001443]